MGYDDKQVVEGCLKGIRVLELARFQAGPRCGMLFSDVGAEVIKIEKPGGEDTRKSRPMFNGQSVYFSVYNRGKKSICLDLRQAGGKAVFLDLVKTADIVIENFRPGTMEKMGLGYDELTKVRPDIIFVRVSGFGQYGPYRDRAAYDTLGQAMSGLMMLTGAKINGEPIGTAFSLVDRITALHATIGALAALLHRKETGEGQVIDVCLMDTAITMVEIPTSYYLSSGKEGGESVRVPYRTMDGWVAIEAGSSRKLNERVYELIGLKYEGNKQSDSGTFFGPRIPALNDWCKQRTTADVFEKLNALGVPVAPVNSIQQVAKDPHLWEREMLVKMADPIAGELYVPGHSIKFSKTPGNLGPVPTPGQHTEEILSKLLNYNSTKIEQLRAQVVI
jgi:CoA:oxalate CoA-transferase